MSTILVVEDDRAIARVLGARLRANGYDVVHAYDATEGVKSLGADAPDLVLLDLTMPGGGGLAVAKCIRSAAATEHLPVVVLTATKDAELRNEVMKYAPAAFVAKPYEATMLLAAIRGALPSAASGSPG